MANCLVNKKNKKFGSQKKGKENERPIIPERR